jgi:hypothetical protein
MCLAGAFLGSDRYFLRDREDRRWELDFDRHMIGSKGIEFATAASVDNNKKPEEGRVRINARVMGGESVSKKKVHVFFLEPTDAFEISRIQMKNCTFVF